MYGLSEVFQVSTAPPVNTAPTASNGTVTTNEDTDYTFAAANFNFADSDSGDTLASVKIVTLPAAGRGALRLNAANVSANAAVTKAQLDSGNLEYTPPANANGTGYASFTFTVNDGTVDSSSAYTMTINVTAVNDPPTVANAIPDQPALVGVAFNYLVPFNTFSDADSDTLSYTATQADGTALPTWLLFRPNPLFNRFSGRPQAADVGTVSVKVTVSDGKGGSVSDEFDITVEVDTTPPTLTSAIVLGAGVNINFRFSETLDLSNLPPVSAFTVTADGNTRATRFLGRTGTRIDEFGLLLASVISQGQTVVVTYTDPTAGDDTRAIQDTSGNDAASFTTGMNGVPAVTNNSNEAPVAPGAPTSLTATASGTTTINLSWTAPVDNGGRVITGYKIEISSDNGSTWTDRVANTNSTTTSYAHTGLAAGTTRHYRVSAINAVGTSSPSDVANATTDAIAPTVVPSSWGLKPTGLAAGAQFRLLFLSSAKRNASSSDIATYNTFVQERAAAGHADIQAYSAGFRVVGCTAAVDARDNTSTTYSSSDKGVPIYWLNGAKVVDDYQDFYDGDWDDEANDKNASGADGPDTSQSTNRPWTGCGHDGTEAFDGILSRALGQAAVRVGKPSSPGINDGPIESESLVTRGSDRPMYGLSEVFQAANAAPTASNGTVTTNEDTDYTFAAASFNFADSDSGDTLASVKIVTLPAAGRGTLTLNAANVSANAAVTKAQLDNGNLKYTPPADANGTGYASFTFTVNDGTDDSTSAYTMTINVTAVNDVPTVANAIPNQSATAGEAFSYAFPENTFSDVDTGATLTYTATQGDGTALPTWLSLTSSTRTFSGTPQAADAGTVSVQVTASDGDGGSVSDAFVIRVDPAPTVVPGDWSLKPTGLAAGAQFRLLFLSSTARNASSTNIADYNSFVQARAAAGHTDIRAYSTGFRVVGCTEAVDARDNTASTYTMDDKGVPIYWLGGAKLADQYEDFYDGDWDNEANSKNQSGANVNTSIAANQPRTGCDHDGTEAFNFSLGSDALGRPSSRLGKPNHPDPDSGPISSDSGFVHNRVRPMYGLSEVFQVNAAPTASNGTVTTNEDTDYTFAAANFNFSDSDSGDTLSSVKIVTLPAAARGALTLNTANVSANAAVTKAQLDNGNLEYTPPADANGAGYASFAFTVNDGMDDSTSAYTMTIDVTAVNDAPTVANAIPDQSAAVGEAFSYAFPENTFSDVDTGATLTYTATQGDGTALPAWLSLTSSRRTFSGTPQAAGTVSVRVTASDGDGGSVSDAFDIRVKPVVPADWSLKPPDLAAGAQFRLLFLSSARRNASSNNIATYNTFIQTRAAAGHTDIRAYSAGFRVVGCTTFDDARDNTASTYTTADTGVPIYWLNGARVADDYQDFYDGDWDDEANNKNESGADGLDISQPQNWPWTGCTHHGTAQFRGGRSVALGETSTTIGRPNDTGSRQGPLSSTNSIGGGVRPMYGLSEVFQVSTAPPANTAPTASNGTVTTNEDTDYTFAAANFNFSDSDSGDTLASVKIVTLPAAGRGALRLNAANVSANAAVTKAQLDSGNLEYTPPANANGTGYASFTFTVNDGTVDSSSAYTMTINVTAVNDAPTVANAIPDQSATAGEAFSYAFPENTFSDVDTGATLTYTATQADGTALPAWLSFADNTRTFAGTPQDADAGTVSVKVTASDGNGGSVSDAFVVRVDSAGNIPPTVVPLNWSLKPTDLAAGAQFRLLFLSSTGRDASSSDIADYNTFVQTLAAAGHTDIRAYSAGFRVVGCTEAVDARDNTASTYTTADTGVPIYWLGGAKLVDDYEDFYDGDWDDEANDKNESGTDGPDTSQRSGWPWTGCADDGTEDFFIVLSYALGKTSATNGRPNTPGSSNGPLSSSYATDGSATRPMYGLSEVFQVPGIANTAPTASNGTVTTNEDTDYAFAAANFNFSDSDSGDTLASVKIVTLPAAGRGALRLNAANVSANAAVTKAQLDNGSLEYTPPANANGTGYASFTFTVNDGTVDSSSAYTMTINVTAVNDAPTVANAIPNQSATAGEAFSYAFPENTFSDVDTGATLSYTATQADGAGLPAWLTFAGNTRTFAGTPQAADAGTVSVKVTASDGNGGSASDAFDITVNPAANTAPTASNGTVTTNEDTDYAFAAANFNFADSDSGDTLASVKIVTLPAAGRGALRLNAANVSANAAVTKAQLDSGNLEYTPPADANGTGYASFTFKVNDGTVDSSSAYTMTINVTAVNDAPTVANAIPNQSATAGEAFSYAFPENTFSDVDTGATLTYTATQADGAALPTWLSFADNTRTFAGTPQAADAATVSVRVTASDGNGGSVSDEFDIRVDPAANTAPTASNGTVTTNEDTDYTFAAANFNFADSDSGDTLASVKIVTLPAAGRGALRLNAANVSANAAVTKAQLDNGNLEYTPPADANGTGYASFTFTVNDGTVDSSSAYTMTINVTAVNDAPTVSNAIPDQSATAGEAFSYAFPENTFSDVDTGATLSYTATQADGTALPAWLTFAGNTRTFAGTPQAADAGTVSVRVTASDGNGGSVSDEFDITVDPAANTAPTASNGTVTTNEDTDYTFAAANFNFADSDSGDTLASVKIVTLPAAGRGALRLNAANVSANAAVTKAQLDNGSLEYTPPADANGTGYASFTFTVNDGTVDSSSAYTMTINVTAVNDAPTVANAIPNQSATVGEAFSYAFPENTFSDVDTGATLTYTATQADGTALPAWLSFAGNTRTFAGTPQATDAGTVLVKVTARDGRGGSVSDTFTLTVGDVGDLVVNFETDSRGKPLYLREGAEARRHAVFLSTGRDAPIWNGKPQRPLTIPLVVTHTGGATEADHAPIAESVTFGVGKGRAYYYVRALTDEEVETGEGLRIDLGPLPPGVTEGYWAPYETIEFVDEALPERTVRFGAEAYTAAEGGAAAMVSIHLDAPVEVEPLEVRLRLAYGGGATAADHGSIPTVVTFAVGEQTQTITVAATDDAVDDDGESVSLSFVHDPNDRVTTGGGPVTATVALEDDDGLAPVTVSFGAATYTATEGGDAATVGVELDAAPGRAVTVPLTTDHAGGATSADYSGIPATVTFGADQTAQTFSVTATDDTDVDGGESVSIGFGALPAGVFAGRPAAAAVALADGSEQQFLVNFETDSRGKPLYLREGAEARRHAVFLSTGRDAPIWNGKPQRPLTIPLVVTHTGGATEADHAPIAESVTFGVGKGRAYYYVRALTDEEVETGEGLRIDLGPLPPGVTEGYWAPFETIEFVDAAAAAKLSVAGPLLRLGYAGALDGGSRPSPRDFVVSAQAPGGARAMVAVTAVKVRGSDVLLDLDRPVTPDEAVTLTYLAAAMHPIRDVAGLRAPPLADEPVRNDTGAAGPLEETAPAGGTAFPAPLAAVLEAVRESAGTERLDLSSRNLTDVSALAGLTGVVELDLSNNRIADLSPLAGLTGLQVLDLRDNQITDVSPLAGLTELRHLDLSGNRIADLWPLAGLTALERLNLADNRVADIATLAGLSGLRALDLSGNRIEELWPLAGLAALERLNLADNRIEDLWPLAGLSGLEVLLLDRNRVADVVALSQLAGLANLGLSGNRIADIGLLSELGGLRRLDLSGNAVAEVAALGDLSGLVWLRLSANPVSDAAALVRLESLRWLWLDSGTAAGMEALAPPPAGRGAAQLWIELTPSR